VVAIRDAGEIHLEIAQRIADAEDPRGFIEPNAEATTAAAGGENLPDVIGRIARRNAIGVQKPQIQALNRTAPMLPMMPTTAQRRSDDYRRNGTIDLFAALDIASGKVISELRPNHTSAQFIKFLNKINREVPAELDVHVILDNLSTHKTPAVHKWLHRR
jgi:hypothetical protein